MQTEKIEKLDKWFQQRGIEYEGIRIITDRVSYGGEALAIVASRAIEEGAVLVTIPKAAVLSVRNTSLAPFLEEHRIGGGLGLVLACMHEVALGPESPWCAYLSSLPAREYLPMFWSEEEQRLLKGTDAASKPEADRRDTASDYETEVVPLLSQGAEYFEASKMTLDSFRVAASWIGSRAFGVDDYHGMALVPFADIFNHKASVVSLSGHYQLEGACMEQADSGDEEEDDDDEDDSQGSDGKVENGGHSSGSDGGAAAAEEEATEEAASESEESGIEGRDRPGITAVSRGSMLDAALFPEMDLRLQIGICGAQRNEEEVLEIIAACPLSEGQEVFNTFGELDNCELVCKYGFALADNPFTTVQLSKEVVVAEASKLLGKKECKRRREYLEEHSDLLDEDEEPFLVLPRGQIGPSLLVAARLLSATPDEFAAVQSLDLTEALEHLQSQSKEEDVPQLVDISHRNKRQRMDTEVSESAGVQVEDGNTEAASLPSESPQQTDGTLEVGGAALGNTLIDRRSAWFPSPMCSLLTACLEERCRGYNHPDMEADKQALQDAASAQPRLDSHCARIAAHTLVLSEKAILSEALNALQAEERPPA